LYSRFPGVFGLDPLSTFCFFLNRVPPLFISKNFFDPIFFKAVWILVKMKVLVSFGYGGRRHTLSGIVGAFSYEVLTKENPRGVPLLVLLFPEGD